MGLSDTEHIYWILGVNYLYDYYTNLPINQEEFLVPILAEDWLIAFSTFG